MYLSWSCHWRMFACACFVCSRYFPCLSLEYGSTTTTVQEHRQAPRIREAEADDDASDEPPRARRTPLVTDALGAHAILCPWRHCSDAPTSCSSRWGIGSVTKANPPNSRTRPRGFSSCVLQRDFRCAVAPIQPPSLRRPWELTRYPSLGLRTPWATALTSALLLA